MYIVWQIMLLHYSSTGVRIYCTGRGSIVAWSPHITSKCNITMSVHAFYIHKRYKTIHTNIIKVAVNLTYMCVIHTLKESTFTFHTSHSYTLTTTQETLASQQ